MKRATREMRGSALLLWWSLYNALSSILFYATHGGRRNTYSDNEYGSHGSRLLYNSYLFFPRLGYVGKITTKPTIDNIEVLRCCLISTVLMCKAQTVCTAACLKIRELIDRNVCYKITVLLERQVYYSIAIHFNEIHGKESLFRPVGKET
jgi:hypothetical protein